MVQSIVSLPRRYKQAIVLLCDLILLPMAFWCAVALRYSIWNPSVYAQSLGLLLFLIPILALPIFIPLGLYRTVVRYADERILITVIWGVSILTVLLASIVFMAGMVTIPRTSFVIFWFLGVGFIGLSRWAARKMIAQVERRGLVERRERIAIYGAGRAGVQLAMALRSSPEYQVRAFFDDNRDLHGTTLSGIRVYNPELASKVIGNYGLEGLVLALPSASRARRRELIQQFETFGLSLKILPGMAELVGGKVRIEDLREVGIEDLLGRDPVPADQSLLASCIEGKNVLVTGAGGSIGSELCRQIIIQKPRSLVLYEVSEYALYKIEQELRQYGLSVPLIPVLGDVKDPGAMRALLKERGIHTVYHAAAYKHVPLVEWNVSAGVLNNVFGTLTGAEASIEAGVETFVLISTDKAVRPTNVMGASKRLAELVLQAYAEVQGKGRGRSATRFCMVRFGNVLGSSGSVVPLFKEQIKKGGPITVTHPDVTRYFMTIPEAAQLVLQAGSMGSGGDVFVLDMGESVKIVDLAKKMIRLSGVSLRDGENPEGDIAIEFTGLRPGEKLYEELLIGNNVSLTGHPQIMRAQESFIPLNLLSEQLKMLIHSCREQDEKAIRRQLQDLVIEYSPAPDYSANTLSIETQKRH